MTPEVVFLETEAFVLVDGNEEILFVEQANESFALNSGEVGPPGARGLQGNPGVKGDQGNPGPGVPVGGSPGQLLAKTGVADYDAAWIAPPESLPAGGTTGQILAKHSNTDGDAIWEDPAPTSTNLAYTASPTQGIVTSDTGTDATLPLADVTNAGLMAPAQVTKLAGIAAGATLNSTDAFLLARGNHTGTQVASTISDFSTAADARISSAVGVTVQALAATLTALAGTAWAANALPIGTGAGTVAQTAFAANTFPARASTGNLVAKSVTDFSLGLLADTDAVTWRSGLGLGTLATQSGTFSGTSSGINTGDQDLSGYAVLSGTLGQFSATTSAQLAGVISDETGTGALVFAGSPALTGTPTAPTAAAATNTTQIATTAFVHTEVANAVTGLLHFQGTTDCSANPNYPAAVKGDAYIVSVAGKIGGASGTAVDIGDWYIATADNAGGSEASVGASWGHMEHNLVGALLASNNLSDLTSPSAARTSLGLGTLATQSGTFSGTSSGTNTGDQTITLTGDVTGSGTGSFAATIANQAVTYAKMQNVSATSRILGRITAGAGSPEELTAANVKTILALTSSDVGLGSVTNDAQTKAAIVPNTAPSAGQLLIGNAGGTAYAPVALSGPVSITSAGVTAVATLNQNTTGSAASLSISGQTGLLTITGLASTSRIKTVRDAADTLLELGGSYTPTGTWTSLTMVTPVLGTPTSGTLTNCTGLPAAGVVGTAAILGANTFTDLQTHTIASANTGVIASTGYSLTGSNATNMIDLAGTWNTSGAPTAIKVNITNTASSTASKLLDLQLSNTSYLSFTPYTGTLLLNDIQFNSVGIIKAGILQATLTGVNSNAAILDLRNPVGLTLISSFGYGWSSGTNPGTGRDTAFNRNAAGVIEANTGTAGTYADIIARRYFTAPSSTNGQSLGLKSLTELTTIAAAATTDTAIQMPANSIVLAVSVRVTTAITCTSTFTVGDSGSATRFGTGLSKAVNTTNAGTVQPYVNASALSVRITPDTTPSDATGRVRVTIYYFEATVATS